MAPSGCVINYCWDNFRKRSVSLAPVCVSLRVISINGCSITSPSHLRSRGRRRDSWPGWAPTTDWGHGNERVDSVPLTPLISSHWDTPLLCNMLYRCKCFHTAAKHGTSAWYWVLADAHKTNTPIMFSSQLLSKTHTSIFICDTIIAIHNYEIIGKRNMITHSSMASLTFNTHRLSCG